MRVQQYFPEELIELNNEIQYHPKLSILLSNHEGKDWLVKFVEICSYCKVALDDTYTEEDIRKIAIICLERLKRYRSIIVIPPGKGEIQ